MGVDEVGDGTSTERRSSRAGFEGFDGRFVSTADSGAVRGRDIDGDPVDCAGKDRRDERRDCRADGGFRASLRMRPSSWG
jgi:hypothetical protein